MKLPIIACLMVISAVLQSPNVFAQIRGEHRGDHRGNDGGRPDRYEGDRNGGGRNDRNRPGPYPEPRPYPHPNPGPRPGPHPGPHPHPGPNPYPGPQPYPRPEPRPAPYPDYPRDNYGEASVQFFGVTRRVNGEWLRVGFYYPAFIDYVIVDVYRAALKIHEAYAVTQSGRRILLSNLSYAGIIYPGQKVWSEYFSSGERIVAIDIRAESMGDYADVSVRLISRYETPSVYPIRY